MNKFIPQDTKQWLTLVFIGLITAASWLPQIDNSATQSIDQGFQRALISFASARALNAAISVAQGTEASVEPAGVGFTFTPGEVLDPVNDLVEQFSNLMLLASLSFGVQKILISMGGYWLVSVLLTLFAAIWISRRITQKQRSPWVSRLLILLIVVRFAIPAITFGSDLLFEKFMLEEYETSQHFIDSSSNEMQEHNNATAAAGPPTEDLGVIDRIRSWSQNISFESPVDKLQETADMAIEHIVTLMVIFIMQTLILPLLILWLFYNLAKRLLSRPARPGS